MSWGTNRLTTNDLRLASPRDVIAAWPVESVGYFMLSQSLGSDLNPGYTLAAAGSTLTPTGIPKLTFAGLMDVVPRNGAGRDIVILIHNADTTTTGTDYAEAFDFSGLTGYRSIIIRGSTDLTNSTTDRVLVGARLGQTGPWTVSAGATTTSLTVSSGTLTAEADGGGLTGMRVRRTSDNNIHRMIIRNSSTVIDFGAAGTAYSNGDTIAIERPGVLCSSFRPPDCGANLTAGAVIAPVAIVGIGVTASSAGSLGVGRSNNETYTFCEVVTSTANLVPSGINRSAVVNFQAGWVDEVGTTRIAGANRINSLYRVIAASVSIGTCSLACTRSPTGTSNVTAMLGGQSTTAGMGNYFRGVALNMGAGVASTGTTSVIGGATTGVKIRVVGRRMVIIGTGQVCGVEFEGVTDGDCLVPAMAAVTSSQGEGSAVLTIDSCVNGPAGGNTGAGIDLRLYSNGATVKIGCTAAVSVSGTVGEIRLRGSTFSGTGALTTYAGLAKTNVVDINKTNVEGTAGSVIGQCKLITNKHGSALAVGEVVRGNGTTNQVVKAQANALPAAVHEVQGVAVTPAANDAEGYIVAAGTPYVLTDGAPVAGNTLYLSAAVAGQATTTSPPVAGTDRKLRLGAVVDVLATPDACYTSWHPENVSVVADGAR